MTASDVNNTPSRQRGVKDLIAGELLDELDGQFAPSPGERAHRARMDQIRAEVERVGARGAHRSDLELLGGPIASRMSAAERQRHLDPERILGYLRSLPDGLVTHSFDIGHSRHLASLDDPSAWAPHTWPLVEDIERVAPGLTVNLHRVMGFEHLSIRAGDEPASFMDPAVRPNHLRVFVDILADLPDGAGERAIWAACRAYARGHEDGEYEASPDY